MTLLWKMLHVALWVEMCSCLHANKVSSLIPITVSTYRQVQVCTCVCVCVFASTRVISLGQVSVCLPVSLYEVSVCPRNAPRPICHWLLLFSSSDWCLEVELCCALASEKYVPPPFAQCICTCFWMKMWLGGKVLRMVNAFGTKMRRLQICSEQKWKMNY